MISRNSAREVTPRGKKTYVNSLETRSRKPPTSAKRNETERKSAIRAAVKNGGYHPCLLVLLGQCRVCHRRDRAFSLSKYKLLEYVYFVRLVVLADDRFNDRRSCAGHDVQEWVSEQLLFNAIINETFVFRRNDVDREFSRIFAVPRMQLGRQNLNYSECVYFYIYFVYLHIFLYFVYLYIYIFVHFMYLSDAFIFARRVSLQL